MRHVVVWLVAYLNATTSSHGNNVRVHQKIYNVCSNTLRCCRARRTRTVTCRAHTHATTPSGETFVPIVFYGLEHVSVWAWHLSCVCLPARSRVFDDDNNNNNNNDNVLFHMVYYAFYNIQHVIRHWNIIILRSPTAALRISHDPNTNSTEYRNQ